MPITTYAEFEQHCINFQWSEPRKDQESLFLTGAEFQAHFLYFAGHTPEKRQGLIDCIEAYNQHFAQHYTWGTTFNKSGDFVHVDIDSVPSIQQTVANNPHSDDHIDWYCASGEEGEAPEYMSSAYVSRAWEGHLLFSSQFVFRVPNKLIFEEKNRKILLDLFQLCIDKLGVYHAVAGIQSALPNNTVGVGDHSRMQGERFWGIYQGADYSERRFISNGIKSIDWLTYLDNTLVQRICPVDTFVNTYCPYFNVHPQQQKNGVLFQLEEYPQLLPVNEPVLPSYYNLNRALRPLRNGAYWAISSDGGYAYDVLDIEATRKWIRRLDAPDIFPDQGHYEERAPKKKIYLTSGKVCEIDGVYRYDDELDIDGNPVYVGHEQRDTYKPNTNDDYRQHIVLLKGDLAPNFLEFEDHAVLKGVKKIKWRLVSEFVRNEVKNER